jgi:hypothetical protein
MTKLLLNTAGGLLHNIDGAPVPPGMVVLDDEMADADALEAEGQLVYLAPRDVPDDGSALLSAAAAAHHAGNADKAASDDTGVSTPKKKAAES